MKITSIRKNILTVALLSLVAGSFSSCKEDSMTFNESVSAKPNIAFVGLTNTNLSSPAGQLIRYNSSNLNILVGATVAITAPSATPFATGESIIAIDYRPSTGQLYGISSASKLYILNPANGVARPVSANAFTPALSGVVAGFDFNPTVDRIRVVTKSGQNFRLNPDDGTVAATDANINGIAGATVANVAYSNDFSGAATTDLYDLDIASAKLYKQDANAGTLSEVATLGFNPIVNSNLLYSTAYNTNITGARTNATGGFDIAPTGEALAVINNNSSPAIPVNGLGIGNPATSVNASSGTPTLFQIDLTTGKTRDLGVVPLPAPANLIAATTLISIAINTTPVGYAVDETNSLLIFNPNKPEPITKAITGLQSGENIVGLDFRPLNGQLYALGSTSRLYIINPASGAATLVGSGPFATALSGTDFGFDFNPTVDAIRIVSNSGQNLRVSPLTGAVTVDLNLNGSASVEGTAAAYTNNLLPSSSTTLYVINAKTDSLYSLANPNDGKLTRVGKLGIDIDASNGFDIGATSGVGYAILTVGAETKLYTINLTGGSATAVASFPKKVRGFTIGLGF